MMIMSILPNGLLTITPEDFDDDVYVYPFNYLKLTNRLTFNCTEEELEERLKTIDPSTIAYIEKVPLNKKLLGYIQFK